jgi:outer membrane lipoprotein SlyB
VSEQNLSAHPAGSVPAGPVAASTAGTGLCVLLACFPGAKRAGKIRSELGQRIRRGPNKILDEVVLQVDARRRVHIYDPRKTVAGTLTTALTWGIFGLLGGGWSGLGVWAILGAICGGLFAYFVAGHPFPKDELKRIGGHLPGDSASIMAFIQGNDGQQILSTAASSQPAAASVAMIGADLSARVLAGDAEPAQALSSVPDGGPAPGSAASVLNMLLLRYPGSDTARQKLAKARSAHPKDSGPLKTELIFEAPERGRLKVIDPTRGPAAAAKSNVTSWGFSASCTG